MPLYVAPQSKYHAVPVTVDGIRFDSQREAHRYGELKLLERVGQIRDLTLQPAFDLHAPVSFWPKAHEELPGRLIGRYRADFAYRTPEGTTIVEDVKGVRTPIYRWKKKHVELEYGVRIVEV